MGGRFLGGAELFATGGAQLSHSLLLPCALAVKPEVEGPSSLPDSSQGTSLVDACDEDSI